jgi:ABC-type branched-subunit amino acid transport system substrate-binding protein
VSPPQIDCTTKDDPAPTYDVAFGQVRYYVSQNKDLHGICVGQNDLRSTTLTGTAHCEAAKQLGIELDGDGLYGVSARAAQSALTPAVSAAREAGSTYVYALQSFGQVVSLRKEAKLQGLNTVEVWDCSRTCYSEQFLETGGADVEDQYAFLNALPLDETKSNKALAAYVKTVGADDVDAFGEVAWAAGMLFTETIEKIVKADGINGITRARFLEELAKTKTFDADGMLAPTDVGSRRPSPCYNLTQVQDGEYVRVHPKKAGTFDCNPKNIVRVQLAG